MFVIPESIIRIRIRLQTLSLSHYSDVIMGTMAFQITDVSIVYSTVCSGVDQREHQRSESPAIVRGIYRWPVNSPHKGPVRRKIFPLDDVIMHSSIATVHSQPETSDWRISQKRLGRQDDCPCRHWGRWSLSSTSPVPTRAVIQMSFPFQWSDGNSIWICF